MTWKLVVAAMGIAGLVSIVGVADVSLVGAAIAGPLDNVVNCSMNPAQCNYVEQLKDSAKDQTNE